MNGGAIVRREARTYEREDQHTSWFRDMAAVRYGIGLTDPSEARARLDRHRAEVDADLPGIERAMARRLAGPAGEMRDASGARVEVDFVKGEQRALTRVDGSGGDFVGPIWLMEYWASANRQASVMANIVQMRPLPPGTDSINAPKVATGVTAAIQATDNSAASSTDLTAGTVTAPVRTVAAQQDISQQMFDQMTTGLSFDQGVVGDLADAYGAQLDAQMLNGTGASGQVKGILQVSGIGNYTYVDATPTVAEMWPKLAGAAYTLMNGRLRQSTDIVFHHRRWLWITAATDTGGRPIVDPQSEAPYDDLDIAQPEGYGGETAWGTAWMNSSIPTNGGGGTEDLVAFVRGKDLFLFVSPPRLRLFPEVGSGTLTMRAQVVTYAAFLSEREPSAICTLTGTGLAAAGVVF